MANNFSSLNEYPKWEEKVYKIRVKDPVLGGHISWSGGNVTHGFANVASSQLANRTLYLKGKVEDIEVLESQLRGRVEVVEASNENLEGRVEDLEDQYEGFTQSIVTYLTKEDMEEDTSQDEMTFGRVVDDTDENNGSYIWDGNEWLKTSLQPVTPREFKDLKESLEIKFENLKEDTLRSLERHITDADMGLSFFGCNL